MRVCVCLYRGGIKVSNPVEEGREERKVVCVYVCVKGAGFKWKRVNQRPIECVWFSVFIFKGGVKQSAIRTRVTLFPHTFLKYGSVGVSACVQTFWVSRGVLKSELSREEKC